jgi:chemotaxis protein CheD
MSDLKTHTVFPGQFMITTVPTLVSTVLGSCVAVCLWDKKNRFGGMNHYLLPGSHEDDVDNANRGLTSTRLLIRSMINRSARLENIEAKVFGGCNSLYRVNDIFKVGERNITIAFDVLKEYGIPVLAHHTGGAFGRKIVFNTFSGRVRMRLLGKTTIEVNEEINKGFGY